MTFSYPYLIKLLYSTKTKSQCVFSELQGRVYPLLMKQNYKSKNLAKVWIS